MSSLAKKISFFLNPTRVITASFALVILTGALLLMLPISAKSGEVTPFINALFTATSATCVTGLITYDTYQYFTVFGQAVIILLIQIGGLGLVTITTFFNFLVGKKLGLRGMQIAQESISSDNLGNVKSLIRLIIIFSLSVEAVGALIFSTVFVPKYGVDGIWMSIFTSISAYCNAGFDLCGREGAFVSLTGYVGNTVIVLGVCSLIIIGGLGFAVWYDILNYRRIKKLTLHSKIVIMMTAFLIIAGTIMFLAFEWNNPKTMANLNLKEKFLAGFFQSVTTRTCGFNTIALEPMYGITKLGATILMFIGAAPGSTGGGIKVSTIAVIIMTVACVIKGYDDTVIMHRKVGQQAVYKAISVSFLALLTVAICSGIIVYSQAITGAPVAGIDAVFEEVSAFGTVGLSVGVTGKATVLSKSLLIFSMYLGRVGPVSLGLSLAMRANQSKKEIMPEGKIMIG